jgi:hypothetical protein
MVTRKPLPPNSTSLPYPDSPTAAKTPGYQAQNNIRGQPSFDNDDDENVWSSEGKNAAREDMPASLRPGNGKKAELRGSQEDLPDSLRVGPASYTPRSSSEAERPVLTSKNPYLRNQAEDPSGGSNLLANANSSASAWGGYSERPPIPSAAPPPPPVPKSKIRHASSNPSNGLLTPRVAAPPIEKFSDLSVSEPNSNPWQPSLDSKPLPDHPAAIQLQREDSGNAAWSSIPPPSRLAPIHPPTEPYVNKVDDGEVSPAWDEDSPVKETPSPVLVNTEDTHEEEHAWEDNGRQTREQEARLAAERVAQEKVIRLEAGWGASSSDLAPQNSRAVKSDATEHRPNLPKRPDEQAPALPPRRSQEDIAPLQPLRPFVDTNQLGQSSVSGPETPGAAMRKQKNQTYEIKKIRWHDHTAASNPRVSPILVQNANGPCPLLALVNALTLTTPAGLNTALVEHLRSREQISLGLLLDAVIDELMSGRRGDAAQELPDVTELYQFLLALHTGMNVNPRFFPNPPTTRIHDHRRSMSHIHPTEREDALPGTFEETREMRLYSTFAVPLIHGWLPEKGSPAFAALFRSAKSYEDAQNLMFREEELEEKLQREGLSFEEQSVLEDITTIKAFFSSSATQLTPFGLRTITESLEPGSVAIMFRNDHFSTLYRHPESQQLMHLVTDMGYAGHEEVVWESLADVSGENCEFFSGDFLLVGGAPSSAHESADATGWTTVGANNQGRSDFSADLTSAGSNAVSTGSYEPVGPTPMSPSTEQEDHDLALALQLQDEEEQRHNAEMARRRRETELSRQYIEQQGAEQAQGRPESQNIPVTARGGRGNSTATRGRGGGTTRGGGVQEIRPMIPPRRNNVDPEAGIDMPPPSYEQAATMPSYNPPTNHPAHPNASPNVPTSPVGPSRRPSAQSGASQGGFGGGSSRPGAGAGGRAQSIAARAGGLIAEVQGGRRPNGQHSGQPVQNQGLTAEEHRQRDKDCIVM